ncbi:MAG: LysR family transcriptional regulator [Candidatus Saccharimonadales bacterium]
MEDRFKKFARIIDQGSYTAAARRLHISQPALTTAIKKLERELKCTLLEQGGKPLRLTPQGEAAYRYAKMLLNNEKNLRDELDILAAQNSQLRLGCIDSIAELLVVHGVILALEKETKLSLIVQNTAILNKALSRGDLDMIITVQQPKVSAGIAQKILGSENLVLACAPSNQQSARLAMKQGTVPDFLAYNKESATYELIASQLAAQELHIQPRIYSSSPSVLLALTNQGLGVTALPQALLGTAKLCTLPLAKPLRRPIAAYYWKDRALPPSALQGLKQISATLQ